MSYVIKALAVSYVIDDDDSVCISVVTVGYGSKSFLASRVPLIVTQITRISLALSLSQVTILVFYMRELIRSQLRWY